MRAPGRRKPGQVFHKAARLYDLRPASDPVYIHGNEENMNFAPRARRRILLFVAAFAFAVFVPPPPLNAQETGCREVREQQAQEHENEGEDAEEQEHGGDQDQEHDHAGEENQRHDHLHHHEIARYTEHVVVTAGGRQEIVNAPVAVTMLETEIIENQASGQIGDLVRQAPGIHAVQMSNKVFSVTGRSVRAAPRGSQFLLLDGQPVSPLYSGVAPWHLIPVGLGDLERVEVINGPVPAAVWGADSMNGVTNLISRTPRDAAGTTVDIRFGAFSRNTPERDQESGNMMSFSANHAAALSDQLAYRLSFGFSQHNGFARPAGEVRPVSGIRISASSRPGFRG